MIDLFSPKQIKELLSKYNAAPLRRFGQNFLINKGVLKKIIDAAQLDKEDLVVEIGPGLGALTEELAKRAKKVVAIEKDKKFVEILKETLKEYRNIETVEGDILKLVPPFDKGGVGGILLERGKSTPTPPLKRRGEKNYKVVANLPYYITSPVIRKFLESVNPPKLMVLMLQKEVAQRICAKPPNMSLLAISVQFYAEPKIVSYVSSGSFWPRPKVDSAILKIIPFSDPNIRIHPNDPNVNSHGRFRIAEARRAKARFSHAFFTVVRAGFSAPRKQLLNNLTRGLKLDRHIIREVLKKAKVNPVQRAETLSVKDWINTTNNINRKVKN